MGQSGSGENRTPLQRHGVRFLQRGWVLREPEAVSLLLRDSAQEVQVLNADGLPSVPVELRLPASAGHGEPSRGPVTGNIRSKVARLAHCFHVLGNRADRVAVAKMGRRENHEAMHVSALLVVYLGAAAAGEVIVWD